MTNARKMGTSAAVTLESGKYQSVAGYAAARRITREAVLKQIAAGKLEAIRIGRAWVVKIKNTN